VAYVRDESGLEHRCEIRDVSESGIAFHAPADVFFRLNQGIDDVSICFDRWVAYRGRVRVTSIREQDGRTLFAATLLDGLMNMEVVCRYRDLKAEQEETVQKIVESTSAWMTPGYRDFKGVMAEYRLFLEEVEDRLTALEPKIPWHVLNAEGEDPTRAALMELFEQRLVEPYVGFLTELDRQMRLVEPSQHPALKAFTRNMLHPYVLQAPLFGRSFEKPLGYAGDYVIMTYIYGRKWEGTSFFGRYAHLAAWHIPVCAAVRSRAEFIAEQLRTIASTHKGEGRPLRILSVAAGPAHEILSLVSNPDPEWPPLDIVLFDQDQQALDFCYRRLAGSLLAKNSGQHQVAYLHDSIKRLLFEETVFAGRGPFDVIVCCGLYDYLPMNIAQKLTAKLYRNLNPGGIAFIGNMAPENPSRFTMEYLAEWYLIYRTPEEVRQMAELVAAEAVIDVVHEPTGINHFLRLERPADGV
jgi:extracellular factor (EF) 3-hydroxypalmitic acid methyl ester biosynthesis protein